MRRLLAALGVLATAGASTPAADAAALSPVTKLRVTGAPSWEQWIERDTLAQEGLGLWVQTACSPREPRITYTLVPTGGTPSPSTRLDVNYTGIMFPLALGKRVGGDAQQHELLYGPVSHPMHFAFYGQHGRDPDATAINQTGRWVLSFFVDTRAPADVLLNWRTVTYRGVSQPAGACAAAGLETYNVLATAPPST